MRTRRTVFTLSVLGSIFIARDAFALNMEYYTYGGFLAVSTAFQKIALIFSDGGYQALFFSVIVLAIVLGGGTAYFNLLRGGKGSALGWMAPIGVGILIYIALISHKGQLTVYDPTLNRFQAVAGIPDGLVAVAGILNRVERGIVDIVHTSSDPSAYQYSASGIGFKSILQATTGSVKIKDAFFEQSLKRYIKDCLFFEFNRPGTNLSMDDIKSNSTNFIDQFQEAASPAIFTLWYDSANKNGQPVSCTDSWINLANGLMDQSSFTDAVSDVCSRAGYNPYNANELQSCRKILTDYVSNVIYQGAISVAAPEWVLRQYGMAQKLNEALVDANPDTPLKTFAAQNLQAGGIAMGLVAREWLPVMRGVFTAVAVGLIPFMALLVPTGVGIKALSVMIGFFVWLTCWGITDAIIHGIATDYAVQAFEGIRQQKLGFAAIMNTPGAAEKGLAIFGQLQTAGIMLATVITGIVVKFGGHALAMMAGNVTGSLQAAAGQAAMKSIEPEHVSDEYQKLLKSIPTIANAGKYSFSKRASLMTAREGADIAGGFGAMDHAGGAQQLQDAMAHQKTSEIIAGTEKYGQMSVDQWGRSGAIYGGQEAGFLQAVSDRAAHMEGGATQSNIMRAARDLGSLSPARTFAQIDGMRNTMQATGFRGSLGDFMISMEKISTMKNYQDLKSYDSTMGRLAKDHFGGDISMAYKAAADFHNVQGAQKLHDMMNDGYTAESAGQYIAHMDALSTLARLDSLKGAGDPAYRSSLTAQSLDQVAKYQAVRKMAGVLMSDSSDAAFLKFAEQTHGRLRFSLNDKMAANLNKHMQAQGYKGFNARSSDMVDAGFDAAGGRFGFISALRGYREQAYALHTSEVGYRSWRGVKDVTEQIKTTTIDHGTLEVGDSLQMALRGTPELFSPIVNARTDQEREAAFAAISSKLAHDLSPYEGRTGTGENSSLISAGVSVKGGLGVISGNASTGVSGRSSDQRTTDLMAAEINQKLHETWNSSKGMGKNAAAGHMAGEMQKYMTSKYSAGANQKPVDYGATAHPVVQMIRSEKGDPWFNM